MVHSGCRQEDLEVTGEAVAKQWDDMSVQCDDGCDRTHKLYIISEI